MSIFARMKPKGVEAKQRAFAARSLTPLMIYTIFFSLAPMIWAVVLGFYSYSPIRRGAGMLGLGGNNPFIGVQNYVAMFSTSQPARQFRHALVTTLLIGGLVLPINLGITLPLAVLIENVRDRLKGFFRTIYFLPVITSSVAVALIWAYIYDPRMGLLNTLFHSVGLIPPRSWLGDQNAFVLGIPLALIAVVVTYIWWDFGYNMVIFLAALQNIPAEIRDAARVDGANLWQAFWHVTLPQLVPTLQFVVVMTMLSAMQIFDIFWVMTQGGPSDQTTPLTLSIYQNAFKYQNMGWAAAISMVLFLIVLIFTLIQRRLLRADWEY